MTSTARDRLMVTVAAVVTMALTFGLGVWQLQRGAAKQALADAMRQRAEAPALAELPAAGAADTSGLWYRRVMVKGRWLDEHTVYLDNRQIIENKQARVGFDVITPLQLADGTAVIVQRGWLPRDFSDRLRIVPVPTPAGIVHVRGRYAPPPPRLHEFRQDEAVVSRVRQNLDVAAYAAQTGLVLRPGSIVALDDESGVAPSPIAGGLRPRWTLPDSGVARHHGYAFQWFGLSALVAGLYVWFHIIRPRRSSHGEH